MWLVSPVRKHGDSYISCNEGVLVFHADWMKISGITVKFLNIRTPEKIAVMYNPNI